MKGRGFSLVELIVVIVIIGVLMVTAIPRLNTSVYEVEGRAEQLATDIRYAQNLAMTRAREHGVEIDASGWQIVDEDGATVRAADGRLSGTYGPAAHSGFTGTILFNTVYGNPDIGSDVSVTLSADGHSRTVVVRTLTGYTEVL